MSRGLLAFVIASGFVTALIVIGAPWLRLASRPDRTPGIVQGANSPEIVEAREFFETYTRLEKEHDLALLELFADTAVIVDRRPSPNGQKSDLNIPSLAFKPVMRSVIPFEKAVGKPVRDYRGVKFFSEEEGVRVEADCFVEEDKFERHLSMFVKPTEADQWLIYELIVDSPTVRQ